MATTEHPSTELAEEPTRTRRQSAEASLPVLMLTVLGTVIAVLGLFAAGEVGLVIIGLTSVAVAGLLHIFSTGRT